MVNKMKFHYGTDASTVEEGPHFCHISFNGWRCDTASRRCRIGTSRQAVAAELSRCRRKALPSTRWKAFSHSIGLGNALFAEVEVELTRFRGFIAFGVYTRPQLKRELKRCIEFGRPWPLVLAVVPPSATRRKSAASRLRFTLKTVFAWPNFAVPGRLVESPITLDVAGYPTRIE